MRWSKRLVNQLVELVTYFRSHSIGWVLEIIGDNYVRKHGDLTLKYSMTLKNPEDELRIAEAEYKLAYMCELADVKKKKNVYQCFSSILSTSIFEMMMKAGVKQAGDFRMSYITLILKENFPLQHNVTRNTYKTIPDELPASYSDEKYSIVLSIAIQLTMILISLANDSLYRCRFESMILVSSSDNFDIKICDPRQGREIRNVLGNPRLIFMKILFILAYEIHREVLEEIKSQKHGFLSKKWLAEKINASSLQDFQDILNNPLLEALTYITSFRFVVPGI